MFLHELVSEQTNKYGFFEYDAQTYKSSFQEHMENLYQDIFYCELCKDINHFRHMAGLTYVGILMVQDLNISCF